MINVGAAQIWMYRILFTVIFLCAVFVSFLPLGIGKAHWYAPDFLLLFSFAWVLRRPEYVPLILIAGVLLLADFLFARPPGLWALISLFGIEFLRKRMAYTRDIPFLFEWAMVAGILFSMALIYRLSLGIFMLPSASLGLVILQHISTLVTYPAIVAVSVFLLKVTRITAAEADQRGQSR